MKQKKQVTPPEHLKRVEDEETPNPDPNITFHATDDFI